MKMNFVKLLSSLGVKFFASMSGFQAWVANIILRKVWKFIVKVWNDALTKVSTDAENKRELKEYEAIIKDPQSTPEQIKDAGKKLLED
jgi:hypothetical protein